MLHLKKEEDLFPPHSEETRQVVRISDERWILLDLIRQHKAYLEVREKDHNSRAMKSIMWDKITAEFNARSGMLRSRYQVQTLYKNMKAKAKKYQVRLAEATNMTAPYPEVDTISESLLKLTADNDKIQRQVCQDSSGMLAPDQNASLNAHGQREAPSTVDYNSSVENTHASPAVSSGSEMSETVEEIEIKPEFVLDQSQHHPGCASSETSTPYKLDINFGDNDSFLKQELVASRSDEGGVGCIAALSGSHLDYKEERETVESPRRTKRTAPSQCPEGATKRRPMARREHLFRMMLLRMEAKHLQEEHQARMENILLERRLIEARLGESAKRFSPEDGGSQRDPSS